jgi:hypothetical protein
MLPPLHPFEQKNKNWYLLNRRVARPWGWYGYFAERNISCPCQKSDEDFSDIQATA